MDRNIPINTIREIIKEYWDGEISQECIEIVQSKLMLVLKDIIVTTIQTHNEENYNKKYYGLRQNKRISKEIIDKAIYKVFKQIVDFECHGEVGQHNIDTTLSEKADEVI